MIRRSRHQSMGLCEQRDSGFRTTRCRSARRAVVVTQSRYCPSLLGLSGRLAARMPASLATATRSSASTASISMPRRAAISTLVRPVSRSRRAVAYASGSSARAAVRSMPAPWRPAGGLSRVVAYSSSSRARRGYLDGWSVGASFGPPRASLSPARLGVRARGLATSSEGGAFGTTTSARVRGVGGPRRCTSPTRAGTVRRPPEWLDEPGHRRTTAVSISGPTDLPEPPSWAPRGALRFLIPARHSVPVDPEAISRLGLGSDRK
jgi:hypothetical protein